MPLLCANSQIAPLQKATIVWLNETKNNNVCQIIRFIKIMVWFEQISVSHLQTLAITEAIVPLLGANVYTGKFSRVFQLSLSVVLSHNC